MAARDILISKRGGGRRGNEWKGNLFCSPLLLWEEEEGCVVPVSSPARRARKSVPNRESGGVVKELNWAFPLGGRWKKGRRADWSTFSYYRII